MAFLEFSDLSQGSSSAIGATAGLGAMHTMPVFSLTQPPDHFNGILLCGSSHLRLGTFPQEIIPHRVLPL